MKRWLTIEVLASNGHRYQIDPPSVSGGLRSGKVMSAERLDGKIKARFWGEHLVYF